MRGKPTAAIWPGFFLMNEVLGQRHSNNPPVLIASISEDWPGPRSEVDDQDEEELAPAKRKRDQDTRQMTKYVTRHAPLCRLQSQSQIFSPDGGSLTIRTVISYTQRQITKTKRPTFHYVYRQYSSCKSVFSFQPYQVQLPQQSSWRIWEAAQGLEEVKSQICRRERVHIVQ